MATVSIIESNIEYIGTAAGGTPPEAEAVKSEGGFFLICPKHNELEESAVEDTKCIKCNAKMLVVGIYERAVQE